MTEPLTRGLVWLIDVYRSYISPLRPPTCRFLPTCSGYAVEALQERGLVVGLCLSAGRLLRCGPWTKGGWDPVPARHACHERAQEGVVR